MRTKYGNVPTTYDGINYHSKLEAAYAAQLDALKKCAVAKYRVARWRRQVPIKLEIHGQLWSTYIVDFVVEYADGRIEFHETKGLLTPEAKLKMKAFRILYPEHTLKVITKV